ncbi:MAG: FHA domain-containing protein [Myxococcales bacterium]|nr:FHA domain-containing protein [Myxococcales bacterium]
MLERGARFCKYCGSQVAAEAPAPSSHMSARVVVILRDGSEGGVYPVADGQTDVGGREGDIVLSEDPYLSPRHARITRTGDTFALQDLGSVNGIYLRIRRPTPLSDADMILVGQQVLRFEVTSEVERQVGPASQHGVMVFGTPEAPRTARLSQYTTEGLIRDVYYLHREETIMGREQADIVFSDDPFLSRRHAAIVSQAGGYVVSDLGSSNGTFVRCRGGHSLASGDQFRVGRHLFRFDLTAGGAGTP